MNMTEVDIPEETARGMNQVIRNKTGMSLFNWLTVASIATSVGLFLYGKKELAIFIGLWPPTFQALKAGNKVDSSL